MEPNNRHTREGEDLSSNELNDSDTKPTKQLAQARQLFIGNVSCEKHKGDDHID